MKTLLITICLFIIAAACNKSNIPDVSSEGLVLDKVIKTTILNSVEVSETINYDYDALGRLIGEGGKRYTRDDKGRIINILLPHNGSNRTNIDVFYNGSTGTVAYTLCRFNISSADSSVYERDSQGRVIKIVSYYKNGNTASVDYFFKLGYDANGNLKFLEQYAVSGDSIFFCGAIYYKIYDDKINPAYSDDEVRIFYSSELFLNAAKSNVIASNLSFSKSHTYRSDGRPASCKVYENGAAVCRLEYFYK
jgi:hypothetical protein